MNNKDFIESITLEGEIWKEISEYNGYSISNFGRIVSHSKERIRYMNNREVIYITQPKILKNQLRKDKYIQMSLSNGIRTQKVLLHRLLCIYFIPNPNNYPHIDHIDGNPSNNNLSNLRWCTPKINANNPIRLKKQSIAFKDKFNTKLSKPVVQLLNNKFVKIYPSINEAGRNGFIPANIGRCCIGKAKTAGKYHWMFLSDYETLINKSKNDLLSQ